jgi:hypothetical protein
MKTKRGYRGALWLVVLVLLAQGQLGLRSMLLSATYAQADPGSSDRFVLPSGHARLLDASGSDTGMPIQLPVQGIDCMENGENDERSTSSTDQLDLDTGSTDPLTGLVASNGIALPGIRGPEARTPSIRHHLLYRVLLV